tara:strand:- start:549 stop:851 length:303 start_codon:yes stop_codon:yes gene_type:complete
MTVIDKEKLFLMKRNIQSCLEEVCRMEHIDITDLEFISKSYEDKRDITYHTYLHRDGREFKLNYHATISSQKDLIGVIPPEGSHSTYYVFYTDTGECVGR